MNPSVKNRFSSAGPACSRLLACLLLFLMVLPLAAQRFGRGRRAPDPRGGAPEWEIKPQFKHDVFTFVRIEYDAGGRASWRGGWDRWTTDYPDADLNFSYRLQQLTSLQVEPKGKTLRITDPTLFDYPFIYIVEPGGLLFRDEEVPILRRYLSSGGFLMVDDFWGRLEYANFYEQIKRVFPDREPEELPLDHPIFHCVFDLKEKPQIPNVDLGTRSCIPVIPSTASPGNARTPAPRNTRPSKTTTAGSWSSFVTTPISATAGNGRAITKSISANSPRNGPTRSASISSFTP